MKFGIGLNTFPFSKFLSFKTLKMIFKLNEESVIKISSHSKLLLVN